jgi:hypothetical protein
MTSEPLVFISHSSKDSARASDVVTQLEQNGVRCWIAPRDIAAGSSYDEEIVSALARCEALVVLVSEAALESRHVRSEVSRAASDGKRVIPVRLIDIEIQGGLKFFLELSQYVDWFEADKVGPVMALVSSIKNARGDAPVNTFTGKSMKAKRRLTIPIMGTVGALILFLGWVAAEFVAASREEQQRVSQEEEAARQEAISSRLQIYPTFILDGDKVVLQDWQLNGELSSDWQGAVAEWIVNGSEIVPFDVSLPKKTALASIDGFSTLELRVSSSLLKQPIEKDYSFEVRKIVSQAIEQAGTNFSSMYQFLRCGGEVCNFPFFPLGVCSPVVRSMWISGAAVGLTRQRDGVLLSREFCSVLDDPAFKDVTSEACIVNSDRFALDLTRQLTLNLEMVDGSQASLNAVMSDPNASGREWCGVELRSIDWPDSKSP